jgi:outer membrane protein assembly factor BamB
VAEPEAKSSFWSQHLNEVIATAIVVSIIGAFFAYQALKRPGDVQDADAPFITAPEAVPRRGAVKWPTYGYDNAKTRFLPRHGMKPPFRRLWSFETNGVLTEFSPVLAGGTLYGSDKHAIAYSLNADTGKVNWRNKVGQLNASSPAYHHGRVFMVNLEPGRVMALNAQTGKKVWQRDLPGRSESSPVVADGKVVFGCECGTLYAVAEKTGKVLWQRDLGGAIKGGPAINNGIVYADDYGGKLSAVRLTDGSVKWQSSSQGQSLGRGGSFYATPAFAFGRVYAGAKDGRMYSYVADTGKLAWSHSIGGEIYASVAVADTPATPPSVYFGGLNGKVYALEARSGKERWSRSAGGSVIGAGSVVGQIFYVANVSKRATAGFSIKTGKRVFGFDAGGYNPVISDGRRIYLTGYSGVLALKPRPPGTSVPKGQKQKGGKKKKHKKNKHKKKGHKGKKKHDKKKHKKKKDKKKN